MKQEIKQEILVKSYSWEELLEIEEDLVNALTKHKIPGEFEGTIRVKVEYIGR